MKKWNKFIPYICFLGCIIFIAVGYMNYKKQTTYPKTTATIQDITIDETVASESASHIVYVEYDLKGTPHKALLDSYDSTMRIGDEIEVLYDETNPSRVSKAGMMSVYIQLGFAGVCLVGGVGYLKKQRKNEE